MSTHKFFKVGNIVQNHEVEGKVYQLILSTLDEINDIYIPYTLYWVMNKRKGLWKEILEIEEGINIAVGSGDREYLEEMLKGYYNIWMQAIVEFGQVEDGFIPF